MKKHSLVLPWLMLAIASMAAGLGAQAFITKETKKPFYFWGGLQLGIFSSGSYGESGLAILGYDFSVQFDHKIYGSIYHLEGSVPLGDNDAIDELGFMVGRSSRTRKSFVGAAIGLGWLSGWLGRSVMQKEIGLPISLEGLLILNRFMALGLRWHAFIWEHPYNGLSLAIQLGKMR
jgi:hypothetical protein